MHPKQNLIYKRPEDNDTLFSRCREFVIVSDIESVDPRLTQVDQPRTSSRVHECQSTTDPDFSGLLNERGADRRHDSSGSLTPDLTVPKEPVEVQMYQRS